MTVVEKGVNWGVWWIITHPWHTIAVGVLLKNPNTRGLMIDHLVLLGRGVIAGTRGSWASIMTRLVVPAYAASRPVVIRAATRIGVGATIAAPPVGVAVGVLATATVIGAVHTAALQQTGMVGPSAPKTSDPSWFGGLEMNPYMFSMGTVV